MEKCPKCRDYTLSYDARIHAAVCTKYTCGFVFQVQDVQDYYDNFVISEINWNNYCAKTPRYVRTLRGTLSPAAPIPALLKA